MLFTYHFADILDLNRFRKQATINLTRFRQLTFHFYLNNYKLIVASSQLDNGLGFFITLSFSELSKDADGEINKEIPIYPLRDSRFQDMKDIQQIFQPDYAASNFDCHKVEELVDKICAMLKILHKINSLNAFC